MDATPVKLLAELRFFSSTVFYLLNGMPEMVYLGLSEKKRVLLNQFMEEIHEELIRPMLFESDPGVCKRIGSLQVTTGKFYEIFSKIPQRAFLAFSVDKQERLVDALATAHQLTHYTD